MNRFSFLMVLALCGVTLFASACMRNNDQVEQQLSQHDSQLRQLQPAQADAQNQIQALQQEINALKGQLSDLQNAGGARALVEGMNKHDAALRKIENNMAMDLDLGEPIPTAPQGVLAPAPGTVPGTVPLQPQAQAAYPSYGMGESANPLPPTAPGTGTAAAAAAAPSLEAQAPSASTWGQPSPQPQLEVPKKDTSLALYDAGVNDFNARKYDAARRSFTDFLKTYPSHNLVPDAQYYLAECHFQKNSFADAALAYDTVIKKYPKSSRAPGAYLKQGICFSKLNQGAASKARLQELIKKFPNSPEATRAKNFLKTNK